MSSRAFPAREASSAAERRAQPRGSGVLASAAALALDRLPMGVVFVDAQSRLLGSNRIAEHILEAQDGLRIAEGRLHASNSRDSAVLPRLVSEIGLPSHDQPGRGGAAFSVIRPSGERPLELAITRVPSNDPPECLVLIFISDHERGPLTDPELLRQLYGLTRAEAALAVLLAEGRSLEEAASELGITVNTSRSRLREVFDKTDTRRQAELVRILMAGPARLSIE